MARDASLLNVGWFRQCSFTQLLYLQAAETEKIFGNLSELQLLLGLDDADASAIKEQLGSLIFRQYLNKQMQKASGVLVSPASFELLRRTHQHSDRLMLLHLWPSPWFIPTRNFAFRQGT